MLNTILTFKVLLSAFLFFFALNQSHAMDVTLGWDANTEPDLAGYKVYYKKGSSGDSIIGNYNGTGAKEGDSPIDVPLAKDENLDPEIVQFTIHGLTDDQSYFFIVIAYDTEGLRSEASNEVANVFITSPQNGFYVNASNYESYTISGTSRASADIELYAGGISLGTTIADGSGNWTITVDFGPISEGAVSLTAVSSGVTSPAVGGTYDKTNPYIQGHPTIDYNNNTINVTYSESDMHNATVQENYNFNNGLLLSGDGTDISEVNKVFSLPLNSVTLEHYIIYQMTSTNINDIAGNPVGSGVITINDNDNDKMPDDWESDNGVDDATGDSDGDQLSNLDEYKNKTNPKNADTDGDDLPDRWEVIYGIDPNNSDEVNGRDGDFDNDGWSNYEEYVKSTVPSNASSRPEPTVPQIVEVIPHPNSGITNNVHVPTNTSFAVRIEDSDGIDITETTSIKFTIDDGVNQPYGRDLSDNEVVRVVKLTSDDDGQVRELWAVYDSSRDSEFGSGYAFGRIVSIKVDAKDRRGDPIDPAPSYDFKIETEAQHDEATASLPETVESTESGSTTTAITVTSDGDLDGFEIIYDTSEPITPYLESSDEIPPLDAPGVNHVGVPANLQPPTVFNKPVKLIVPCPGHSDVRDLNLYLYNGSDWVFACSSYNAGGEVQPGGEGWVVPGSLKYRNHTSPAALEVQVYHFSAIQAGFIDDGTGDSGDAGAAGGGGGGGCFISALGSIEPQ